MTQDRLDAAGVASLREQTISGAAWSSSAAIGRQALTFLVQIVLAHILVPADFGVAAMILVVSNFGTVLVEGGFGAALVHRRDLRPDHVASVAVFCAVGGVALGAGIALAGPIFATFYDHPDLSRLAWVVGLAFAISGLNVVPEALLVRGLRFKRLGLIEVIAVGVSGGVAIVMALAGYGPFSIAWQAVALSATETFLLWSAARPTWRHANPRALRELSGFGAHLLGFNTLNYWLRNADNVIVGRKFGDTSLGLYSRSYALMLVPVEQIGGAISRVMFPSLARMGDDLGRVRLAYLRAVRVDAVVMVPLTIFLAVGAEEIVLTLLGTQWLAMVPILRVLAALGAVQSITSTVGWIYTSLGRTDLLLAYSVGASAVILASFAIGAWWGSPLRVAISYALASGVVLTYPGVRIPTKLIGLRFRDVAGAVREPLVAAAVMAGIVLALRELVPGQWPVAIRLMVLGVAGLPTYVAMLAAQGSRGLSDLAELAPGWLGAALRSVARRRPTA